MCLSVCAMPCLEIGNPEHFEEAADLEPPRRSSKACNSRSAAPSEQGAYHEQVGRPADQSIWRNHALGVKLGS
jgi:hypothetical protein